MKRLLLVLICVNGINSVNAAPLNTELVVNGGAETGNTTGWISTGIDADAGDVYSAGFGAFAFTGGLGAASQTLLQTIDVSGNAIQIDLGEITSIFQANLQSRADPNFPALIDLAKIDISFLNAVNGLLGSFSYADTINPTLFDWNTFSDTRLLPSGTRSIQILLTSSRDENNGISSDGFIDDVSLRLTAPNVSAVPEPETYALLLAGLGLLGFTARRRKQKAAA